MKTAMVMQERIPTVETVKRAATQASDLIVTPDEKNIFGLLNI
jgi:hypothetical protein